MKYIPYKSYINNALFLAVSNNAKKAIVTNFVSKIFNPSDAVKSANTIFYRSNDCLTSSQSILHDKCRQCENTKIENFKKQVL